MKHFTVWLWLGSVSISRVHRAALLPCPSPHPLLPRDRVGFIYGAAAKVTVEHWPGPVSRVRASIQTSDKHQINRAPSGKLVLVAGAGGSVAACCLKSGVEVNTCMGRWRQTHNNGVISMLGINNDKFQNTHAKVHNKLSSLQSSWGPGVSLKSDEG